MLIYVAHKYSGDKNNIEKAKKITHDLQVKDLANCYICPLLTFSCLEYGEIGYDAELELCLDVLSVCDRLVIASEISKGMQTEIDFAKLVKMEVMRLDKKWKATTFHGVSGKISLMNGYLMSETGRY